MTAERWQHLKEVFSDVSTIPLRERESSIVEACSGDPLFEQELRRLLEADADDGFLDNPVAAFEELLPRVPRPEPRLSGGDLLCDRFKVDRFIARGGMGEVYSAYDQGVREAVAIKVIRPEIADNPAALEQFASEVRRARAISSPYVCRVHDLFTAAVQDTRPVVFLSMQLLEGETLAQRLARAGALTLDEALPLVCDIAKALEAAHSQEIVHGDLKPSNIMLVRSRDGSLRAIVTDFGLARRPAESGPETDPRAEAFGGGGTPAYMAPEQLEGAVPSPAADIYALGLIAFEMVTAARPFPDVATWNEQSRRLTESPPAPSQLAPQLPPLWDAVILRCLERDPAARFLNATSIVDAFQPAIAPAPQPVVAHAPHAISRRLVAGAAAVLMAAGAITWRYWARGSPPGVELPARSVVIVPFENASGNPEEQYYSEAITDEIARAVASLPDVTVIGRDSSYGVKRTGVGPAEIGKQLKARYVLVGAVSRSNGRVNILTQLVDASSGAQIFSRDYAGDLPEVTQIKGRIAQAVGKALKVNLAGMQLQPPLSAMQMKAYELYWIGRFHLRKRTDEAVRASLEYFRNAIKQDRAYAPAYTGLADAICVLAERNLVRPSESLPEAKRAARTAVDIDSKLADAYVSLAQVTSLLDFDLTTSESHFRRALQLDQTLAPAHHWYSYLLVKQRRFKEAQQHAFRALELEPLSLPVNINVALQYYYAGDDDRAVQQCRKLAVSEPALMFNHFLIAQVFARKGLAGEAMNEMSRIRADGKEHPLALRSWAELYGTLGQREKARDYIAQLIDKQPAGGVPSSYIAAAYASVGDIDKAYVWLERAFNERDSFMPMVDVYPAFASIRNDARYDGLLRRIGLKQGTEADSTRPQ